MHDDGHVLEFRLPDLGEGHANAELLSWAVGVGDTVELNQTIGEVETTKAVLALPSPFSGTVVELLARPGDTVPVGAPLIRVRTDLVVAPPIPVPARPEPEREARVPVPARGAVAEAAVAQRDPRRPAPGGQAVATPAARALAKELGIDLWYIAGSGPQGAVTVEDVRASVPISAPRAPAAPPPNTAAAPQRNGHQGGLIRPTARETGTPVNGLRKRIAGSMVVSARTIPQAAAYLAVDVTASMELLDHLRATAPFAEQPPTALALVAKAVVAALVEHPGMNVTWDDANQQIVTKYYVNLGIVVATERGLLVPNLKEAHTLGLRELVRDIGWLTETARSGSATPVDLRGGTFTLTDVGYFGVDTAVPLVIPGEGAILSVGSIRKRPWVVRDELAVRWVTTLAVGVDQRMIDGELASRFLSTVGALLEDPLTLLSRG
ncbi:dihydrolipoamide acetyltransferase family protein [Nocardia takedensis]|uniref:dihydrolipoamide acetyltransferase family protein n=1 Tax=Nocardia takedensis TaxID=259390 RepID=UPI00031098B5|nr:dihydrolipoamide acetyltransferase family protein [Nocardia takedensis]